VPQAQGGGRGRAQSRGGNSPARVGGAWGGRRSRSWTAGAEQPDGAPAVAGRAAHHRASPQATTPRHRSRLRPPTSPLRRPGRIRQGSMVHSAPAFAPQSLGRAEERRRCCICYVRLPKALAASPRSCSLCFPISLGLLGIQLCIHSRCRLPRLRIRKPVHVGFAADFIAIGSD
jgi:hypothetical protein